MLSMYSVPVQSFTEVFQPRIQTFGYFYQDLVYLSNFIIFIVDNAAIEGTLTCPKFFPSSAMSQKPLKNVCFFFSFGREGGLVW